MFDFSSHLALQKKRSGNRFIVKQNRDNLKKQFLLIQGIRNFFNQEEFFDVLTPPMVKNPGMEVHIHPYEVYSAKDKNSTGYYLHTSPEFHMKELLSFEYEKIFTINYCFREEPKSDIHNNQFIMLEWYRKNERYEKIMDDCEKLVSYSIKYLEKNKVQIKPMLNIFEYKKMTVQELFFEVLNIDILSYLSIYDLKEMIKTNFPEVPLPDDDQKLGWDDYFFLLFFNKIEPEIKKYPYLLLYEFPNPLCALSTLKDSDQRVAERFEIYLNGIELCNCFNELGDLKEQKKRFKYQEEVKKRLYGYDLPEPDVLYNALNRGIGSSAGIALGVERLLHCLINQDDIFWRSL